MIARWRCFSRTLIVGVVAALMLTASAASAALLTGMLPPIASEAMTILAWVFTVIMALLGFAAAFNRMLVLPVIERQHEANRAWLKEAIGELGKGFDALIRREITNHVESEEPHPKASAHMHAPLKRADEELLKEIRIVGRRLRKLTHAHNEAMKMERGLAATVCAGHRGPRRVTDPPDADFGPHAEVPPLTELVIPDDEEEEEPDEPDQP